MAEIRNRAISHTEVDEIMSQKRLGTQHHPHMKTKEVYRDWRTRKDNSSTSKCVNWWYFPYIT